jgi:hypothetical protein
VELPVILELAMADVDRARLFGWFQVIVPAAFTVPRKSPELLLTLPFSSMLIPIAPSEISGELMGAMIWE